MRNQLFPFLFCPAWQVIDKLLAKECAPDIEKRRQEGEALIKQIGLFLQMQAGHIQVDFSCFPAPPRLLSQRIV